jgi:hypothetical protein
VAVVVESAEVDDRIGGVQNVDNKIPESTEGEILILDVVRSGMSGREPPGNDLPGEFELSPRHLVVVVGERARLLRVRWRPERRALRLRGPSASTGDGVRAHRRIGRTQ